MELTESSSDADHKMVTKVKSPTLKTTQNPKSYKSLPNTLSTVPIIPQLINDI